MGDVYLALLRVFVPLSLVSVGGGQSVIAGMQAQVVQHHHWLTAAQFVQNFAVSRIAPGPGSLLVTLIGWQVAGILGAIVASIAIFVPSSLLVYAMALVWNRYRGARWQRALNAGLQPVAAGMILAAGLILLRTAEGGWLAWAIAIAATALLVATKVSPILLMVAGALIFALLR